MTQAQIAKKYKIVKDKLCKHDAQRKIIEADLLALQHQCEHPNGKSEYDSGWGRMSSTDFNCPDCGFFKYS